MSKSQMPPVPPASRTDKGSRDADTASRQDAERSENTGGKKKGPPENLAQQGRQGNINQNTHHQGYQQDR